MGEDIKSASMFFPSSIIGKNQFIMIVAFIERRIETIRLN